MKIIDSMPGTANAARSVAAQQASSNLVPAKVENHGFSSDESGPDEEVIEDDSESEEVIEEEEVVSGQVTSNAAPPTLPSIPNPSATFQNSNGYAGQATRAAPQHVVNVENHYNQRQRVQDQLDRETSPILELRNLNNAIKSILIQTYTPMRAWVLDIACGAFGDLQKFAKTNIGFYVGVDLAKDRVLNGITRYNEKKREDPRLFPALFGCGSCFDEADKISNYIPENMYFDMVSCQFSFHYAFSSEERVRAALVNISERLMPGGYFICTTIDSNVLVKKLRLNEHGSLEFGNQFCRVKFRAPVDSNASPFGHEYTFKLAEAVDECSEYLVHIPTLGRIASEYNLTLHHHENFTSFITRHMEDPKFQGLLRRIPTAGETFAKEQWDIAYLYTVLVLRKDLNQPMPQRSKELTGRIDTITQGLFDPSNMFQMRV
eukprot:c30_g1_i1.p1 GENE.c30_g1_i1~~c30_g1_i1.p1  ORF type:complete len:447 (+),score=106.82 c30_g1_i1:43-1341(+)